MLIRKRYILYIVLFIIILYTFYYYIAKVHKEEFISPKFQFFVNIKNFLKFLDTTNSYLFYNLLLSQKEMRKVRIILLDLKKFLEKQNKYLLKFLNSDFTIVATYNGSIILLFDYGYKNLIIHAYIKFLSKFYNTTKYFKIKDIAFNNFSSYKITILANKQDIYITFVKNILIISFKKWTLAKSLNNFLTKMNIYHQEDYLMIRANLNDSSLLTFLFRYNFVFPEKYFNNKLYKSKYTGISIDTGKNFAYLVLYSAIDYKIENFYKICKISDSEILSGFFILPENTRYFYSIKINNTKEFLDVIKKLDFIQGKRIKRIEEKLKKYFEMPITKLFFSWFDNEIIIANINQKDVFFLKIKNFSNLYKVMKQLKKSTYFTKPDIFIYKKYKIYKLKIKFIYDFLSNVFVQKQKLPYYMIWNNFFVISFDKNVLKSLINKYKSKEVIINFDKSVPGFIDETGVYNFVYYWNKNQCNNHKGIKYIMKNFKKGLITLNFGKYNLNGVIVLFN